MPGPAPQQDPKRVATIVGGALLLIRASRGPGWRPARRACAVAGLALALGCGAEPVPPLRFTPALLPGAAVGQPYLGTLAVSGNLTPLAEVGVSSGALPPGLAVGVALPLTLEEIQVSGTPTAAGTFQFTLRVACFGTNRPGQQGEQAYALVVAPEGRSAPAKRRTTSAMSATTSRFQAT